MKVAQQEQLLLFLNRRHAGQRCHCGVNTEETVNSNAAPVHKCKARSCCSYNLLNNFNCPGHDSTTCPPLDFKPNGSVHLYHLKNSKAGAHQALAGCCLQTTEMEAYAVLCPKRLHIFSFPSLAVCNSNNSMCSLASPSNSASVCTVSSSLCPSLATCCKQQKLHAHHCYTSFFAVGENTTEREVRDADPPCPVLKREQSPSPPPLSPIPSDGSKKCDEKPPSLLPHRQWEEDTSNPSHQEANIYIEKQQQDHRPPTNSHSEQNPSVTILQDVMNRFSEKLETIRPVEKDPPLDSTVVCVSENEPPPSPSTSHKVHFHGDAHLTEIITTVLHTGSASDYNLNELFHHQESKGPKSPNTRSRRRQEVLAALATPHDASSRRHTLQIKRELALLDQSRTRRKLSLSKRAKSKDPSVGIASSNTNSDTEGPKQDKDMELEPLKNNRSRDGSPKFSMAEYGKDKIEEEIKAVVITQEVLDSKAEQEEMMISNEEAEVAGLELRISGSEPQSTLENTSLKNASFQAEPAMTSEQPRKVGRPHKSALCDSTGANGLHQESQSGHDDRCKATPSPDGNSKDGGRTRRKIVPPQRFSSFVTESRKMYYVACFSENIFSKEAQKGSALYHEPDSEETHSKSTSAERPQESTHYECGPSTCTASHSLSDRDVSVQDKSPTKNIPDRTGCLDRGAEGLELLQSTSNRMQDVNITSQTVTNVSDATTSASLVDIASNCQLQFTSPIKLMFVSPVEDKEGVRYSLKAAGPGCKGQAEEPFDPCEESSWTPRTPQKQDIQNAESDVSQMNSVSSPVRSSTSPSPRAGLPSRSVSPLIKAKSSPPTRSSSLSPSKLSSPAKHSSTALKSGPSPRRSPTSPVKSLRLVSSSPKISPRRSGEGAPSKLLCDVVPLVEAAPQKRRRGRPKKVKTQPEQKVKRPIGRPRKQKDADSATGAKHPNGNADKPCDVEETTNKNLKITVVYGRSRRNKRTVSESFDQLQTEFRDPCQARGPKSDLKILTHSSDTSSVSMKSPIVEPEILHFITPLNESTTQSSSNIKCQKWEDSAPIRKPGRPAKIKISGISVTVTTMSPRRRKIQMKKNPRQAPKTLIPAKTQSPELKAAKSPLTIHCKLASKNGAPTLETETQDSGKDRVGVRHSARVRKPSIHFLHAVATSAYRSYSRSNALLRRSKQFLLNKVSNERKQAEHASGVEVCRGEELGGARRQSIAKELGKVAGVTVDSIFSPKEALKWWAASAEENTMNQEFARRIRLISDTWVSDMAGNQKKETALNSKPSSKYERKTRAPSVVRALFDCSPNKPRSCSMQQLCSWFMKTTETRSLAIVKKTSSRNPYEMMHFPRPGSNKSMCHSPQTERLRKHIKKFAKIVPKSPLEHRLMQRQARAEPRQSARTSQRKLFTPEGADGEHRAKWRCKKVYSKYQATLCRARTRFSNQRDKHMWQRQRSKKDVTDASNRSVGQPAPAQNLKRQALRISKHCRHLEHHCATGSVVKRGHPVEVPKEQNLCCKAWSPEKLKECRVFLRKINSPDSESAEEEWDSCTVTLDDGWPSADLNARRQQELAEVVQAVKTKRRRSRSGALPRKRAGSAPREAEGQKEIPTRGRKGKRKLPGDPSAEPPPAKLLRQSRMRGLTGPRWCDFVLGNYFFFLQKKICFTLSCHEWQRKSL